MIDDDFGNVYLNSTSTYFTKRKSQPGKKAIFDFGKASLALTRTLDLLGRLFAMSGAGLLHEGSCNEKRGADSVLSDIQHGGGGAYI